MRVDNDLQPKVIQCDIHGANGLAFSADRRWMYTSDTPNAVIYRTPLDEQGEPGRREVFRRFQPGEGIPDGAAIDVAAGRGAGILPDAGSLPDDGLLRRGGYENALYHHHPGKHGGR